MRKEYDFSHAKRAKEVPHLVELQAREKQNKARVTMFIDEDILKAFREKAVSEGKRYQSLINEALRHAIAPESAPVTLEDLRQILREELHLA